MSTEALLQLIADYHTPQLHCHVLIDPLAIPENSDQSVLSHLNKALGEGAMSRVIRADLPHAPQLHPVLACLSSPGAKPSPPLLKMTAHAAQRDNQRRKRHVCGWLLSEAPAPVIAAHLAALCRLPGSASEPRFYPLYEPVRLELLAASFEHVERGPWWPIKHWLFVSSGAQLAGFSGEARPRSGLPASALRIQDDVALIEMLLAAWRALPSGPADPKPRPLPPFAAVKASNHIDDARRLGLSATDDILIFALYHLYLHPRLHAAPYVRQIIDAAVQQQRPLAPLLARHDDAHWRQMIATLGPSEVRP
ncbi:hypothetical protein OSW16_19920 [Pseudomonas putida]|uniref:hypothetical protein n=1 Tax=Pseudomonas putida TaxID=303 RepID=UPI00226EB898|nr:hypothetical protein [Pseudomonas putida]WAB96793.1 hypothetical protein OSW16_19920 [Pseudomonas putida]